MKSIVFLLAMAAMFVTPARAGALIVSNSKGFSSTAIVDATGMPLTGLDPVIVAVGTFASAPATALSVPGQPIQGSQYAALLAEFTQFGPSRTLVIPEAPLSLLGVFDFQHDAVVAGTLLGGKPVYVIVAKGASLESASRVCILRTTSVFDPAEDENALPKWVGVGIALGTTLIAGSSSTHVAAASNLDPTLEPAYSLATLVNDPKIQVSDSGGLLLSNPAATIQFDPTHEGESKSLSFQISNQGATRLSILGTSLDLGSASDFTISTMPAPSLAPGETTTLTVNFSPSIGGSKTATLRITSDDPYRSPFLIPLAGLATPNGPDRDGDGIGNGVDPDDDNDGVPDLLDDLPLDPTERVDTDGDGIGNNADPDDDGDGLVDHLDPTPLGVDAFGLDLSFGNRGKVTTAVGSGSDEGYGVAVQADGKILVSGNSADSGGVMDFALVRYLPDGTLDRSFPSDGPLTTPIGAGEDRARAVAVQADGKIVVAGHSHNGSNWDFAVVRYLANGTLDTTFSGDGKATAAIGSGHDYGMATVIQPDGKIVVGGFSAAGTNWDFSVVRFTSSGVLDTTFSGDGRAMFSFVAGFDRAHAVALQGDGKIVLAGYAVVGSISQFAVARLTTGGALDTSFSGDGLATLGVVSGENSAYGVAVQPDGKIVLAGVAMTGGNDDFALARLNANGALDPTFGNGGKVITQAAGDDVAVGLAIQNNGKIVAGGRAGDDMAVVRYLPTGGLDPTFAAGGRSVVSVSPGVDGSLYNSLTLQANGNILLAGYAHNGSNYDIALLRFGGDPVEEAPTGLSLNPSAVTENVSGIEVGLLTATDANFNETFSYALVDGAGDDDNDFFTITPTNRLRLELPLDYEAAAWRSLRIRVTDSTGLWFERTVLVTVQNSTAEDFDGDGLSEAVENLFGTSDLDADSDDDGINDALDAFPTNAGETTDSDGDGMGNNADLDDDNDGTPDVADAFPLNPLETLDTDGDGIGNNADPDDDNDGQPDLVDPDPLSAEPPSPWELDPTYGNGGLAIIEGGQACRSVESLADGKVMLALGDADSNTGGSLMRLGASGSPDPTWVSGAGGWVVSVTRDGNKVVLGSTEVDYPNQILRAGFAVRRFLANGDIDPGFAGGGAAVLYFPAPEFELPNAIVSNTWVDDQQRVIVAGNGRGQSQPYNAHWGFGLARFTSSGQLDPAFASGTGWKWIVVGDEYSYCHAAAPTPDGGAVMVGAGFTSGHSGVAVARISPNGSFPVFSGVYPVGSGAANGYGVAVDALDRVVVVGSSPNGSGQDGFVMRILPNGLLDPTFGLGGKVIIDQGWAQDEELRAVSIQANDRIVAVGSTNWNEPAFKPNGGLLMVRLRPDGSSDGSFAPQGRRTIEFSENDRFNLAGMKVTEDGKWLFAGNLSRPFSTRIMTGRLKPVGSGTGELAAWATAQGLSGADALAGATPFNDGVSNLLKYAFNMKGNGPDTARLIPGSGVSGLPTFSLSGTGPIRVFEVEFVRRRNSGLNCQPKWSSTLAAGTYAPMTGETIVVNIDVNWERVRVRQNVNLSLIPRMFGVVEVSGP